MPKQNKDRSKSRIVKMPQLHADTVPADVWFEAGMIHFEDPRNPEEVATCTVRHFEDYLDECLWVFLNDEEIVKKFVCGTRAARRFHADAKELVREAKSQLHVGLPIETISDIEASRAGVTRRSGFEAPGLIAAPSSASAGRFTQRSSGLIVPN